MRLVSTSMIQPDMVLAKSIYYNGCLLLKAGQTDIAKYCKNLQRIGIEHIYVDDEKSEGIEIPDAVSEETRVACKKAVQTTMETFSKNSTLEFEYISDVVEDIINDIMLNKDVQVSLNDIGATDEYTFVHSVSTTVYSLLIAQQLNYSRSMLKKLAAGTLLHDLGKVLLDKEIVFKAGRLNDEEFEYVKTHTTLGYHALKSCNEITELSRIISLFHHETMDGTGYPRGVKAGELHEFARIVAIADVYDALTSDRCYRKKWSNEQAVNFLLENADTKFDTKLVALFIQQIAIYPNGSIVRLSTGQYAIVKEQNRSMPFRPIVRVIADEMGRDIPMYEVNLLAELSITIIESEIDVNKGV